MSEIYVEDPVTGGSARALMILLICLDDKPYKHCGLEVGTPVYLAVVKNAAIYASPQFLTWQLHLN